MPYILEDETSGRASATDLVVNEPTVAADSGASPGLPSHVALIMDGNGRWASARGLPRIEGHRRGLEALRGAVRTAIEFKLGYLTVYSFSSENWSRPFEEIQDLMGLLKRFIRKDLIDLHKVGVRVKVIGHRDNLQPDIRGLLDEAEAMTRLNQGVTLVVAFNYGGRQEIAAAVREIAHKVATGTIKESEIDERMLSQHLDTSDIPDPDLIIRTSGEQRLSNFLLWQAAYSEFVFLPVLWPDFDRAAFAAALAEYAARDRRFGGVSAPRVAVRAGS
ncbi:isoprenyl transferase [Beijerinckia sp. L45]|uniref:isoprenyl transferase n=1 Tax=Beijerinckia sp. L45 TaxID=1641855 RepID=UPI00131D7D86|nr:isoprenyl transferase [Beijerinckia sp. L45]